MWRALHIVPFGTEGPLWYAGGAAAESGQLGLEVFIMTQVNKIVF